MGCCASSAATAVRAEDELEELEFTSAEDVELRNQARRMFAMVDADGSGALDKGEVAVLCAELGLGELSASELDAAMFEMDDDRSGTVNFGEFLQWCPIHKIVLPATGLEPSQMKRVSMMIKGCMLRVVDLNRAVVSTRSRRRERPRLTLHSRRRASSDAAN